MQHERDESSPCAGHHVLQPVELVGNRTVGDRATDARIPERLTGSGVVGAPMPAAAALNRTLPAVLKMPEFPPYRGMLQRIFPVL